MSIIVWMKMIVWYNYDQFTDTDKHTPKLYTKNHLSTVKPVIKKNKEGILKIF